jgi:hypothetical protein
VLAAAVWIDVCSVPPAASRKSPAPPGALESASPIGRWGSSSVLAGSYQSLSVAPTASTYLRVVITAKKGVALGTVQSWLMTATSLGDPLKQDAVLSKVKVLR